VYVKLSNVQLRLLLPVVAREARENPSVEWDEMLERLIGMAVHRGENKAVEGLGGDSVTSHTPVPVSRHPLM
jgi:hypothetical protein